VGSFCKITLSNIARFGQGSEPHEARLYPWLRLFECRNATVAGGLNDDFMDEELFQDTRSGLLQFVLETASSAIDRLHQSASRAWN
jgi:hypothetical protein